MKSKISSKMKMSFLMVLFGSGIGWAQIQTVAPTSKISKTFYYVDKSDCEDLGRQMKNRLSSIAQNRGLPAATFSSQADAVHMSDPFPMDMCDVRIEAVGVVLEQKFESPIYGRQRLEICNQLVGKKLNDENVGAAFLVDDKGLNPSCKVWFVTVVD